MVPAIRLEQHVDMNAMMTHLPHNVDIRRRAGQRDMVAKAAVENISTRVIKVVFIQIVPQICILGGCVLLPPTSASARQLQLL